MGYDITLHPISRHELHEFFVQALDQQVLIESFLRRLSVAKAYRYQSTLRMLIEQITNNRHKQQEILSIYEHFLPWRREVEKGRRAFTTSFGYAAAALAGYLHPYWYLRGTGISALAQQEPFFRSLIEPLASIAAERLPAASDSAGGLIVDNYQGAGYIDNSKLALLNEALHQKYCDVADAVLGTEGLAVFEHVLAYAQQTKAGLLEASDIVVPAAGEFASDQDNLRAAYLGNLDDYHNAREHEHIFTSLDEALEHRETATILNLSEMTEPGPLSQQIVELTALRRLIASKQPITALPACIGEMQQLEAIHIVFGQLTSLPAEIGQLGSLKELWLQNNQITELPATIGQLAQLQELYLNGNQLMHLPESIGDLANLRSLVLRYNHLPQLPETIGRLKQLSYLTLERNQLQTLPESLTSLGALKKIRLADNRFTRSEKIRLKKVLPSITLQFRD